MSDSASVPFRPSNLAVAIVLIVVVLIGLVSVNILGRVSSDLFELQQSSDATMSRVRHLERVLRTP